MWSITLPLLEEFERRGIEVCYHQYIDDIFCLSDTPIFTDIITRFKNNKKELSELAVDDEWTTYLGFEFNRHTREIRTHKKPTWCNQFTTITGAIPLNLIPIYILFFQVRNILINTTYETYDDWETRFFNTLETRGYWPSLIQNIRERSHDVLLVLSDRIEHWTLQDNYNKVKAVLEMYTYTKYTRRVAIKRKGKSPYTILQRTINQQHLNVKDTTGHFLPHILPTPYQQYTDWELYHDGPPRHDYRDHIQIPIEGTYQQQILPPNTVPELLHTKISLRTPTTAYHRTKPPGKHEIDEERIQEFRNIAQHHLNLPERTTNNLYLTHLEKGLMAPTKLQTFAWAINDTYTEQDLEDLEYRYHQLAEQLVPNTYKPCRRCGHKYGHLGLKCPQGPFNHERGTEHSMRDRL